MRDTSWTPWVIASEKHRLEVRAAVGDGGQLLIGRTPVEYLCELCHRGSWKEKTLIFTKTRNL